MNYQKHYDSLINKRIESRLDRGAYSERHHILPKSLGGDNSAKNIVRLTAREHLVAHLLLAKIYGGPMWVAIYLMTNIRSANKDVKSTSRLYEKIRIKHAARISKFMSGPGHPRRGVRLSDEEKENISKMNSGENSFWYGRTFSDEHKKNISNARKKIKLSDEHKRKLLNGRKNAPITTATRAKISSSLMGHEVSAATKLKISRSLTGRIMPEEQRIAMIGKYAGENSPNYGKKMPEHQRLKMIESKTGAKLNLTKEQRKAISDRSKGNKYYLSRVETKESRKKKSAAAIANWGNEEHRKKVSASQKASWTDERREAARIRMIETNRRRKNTHAKL